ncbi:hypothetical protein WGM54_14180 [Paenibacillus polymyxa]|uniref:hypothetical protein n=1 Tax=Paenibacillus polymyxa TaxID=1406 RepID=UPI00307F2641
MKILIFQLPMVAVYQSMFNLQLQEDIVPIKVGYITLDAFDRNECWHLGNWTAWTDEKPQNLHYEGRSFSSDVIFLDPSKNRYHCALPFGWYEANTLREIINYIKTYKLGQELIK